MLLFGASSQLATKTLIPRARELDIKTTMVSRNPIHTTKNENWMSYNVEQFPHMKSAYITFPSQCVHEIVAKLHHETNIYVEKTNINSLESFAMFENNADRLFFVDNNLFNFVPKLGDYGISKIDTIHLTFNDTSCINGSIVDVVRTSMLMYVAQLLSQHIKSTRKDVLMTMTPFITSYQYSSFGYNSTDFVSTTNFCELPITFEAGYMKNRNIFNMSVVSGTYTHFFDVREGIYQKYQNSILVETSEIPKFDSYTNVLTSIMDDFNNIFVLYDEVVRCWDIVEDVI